MVVEFLTFKVPVADRQEWLRADADHWTRFLESQQGFIRKEIWVPEGDPGTVHAVIWWSTLEAWHSISDDALDEVRARMGELELPATLSTFEVLVPDD